MEKRHIQQRPCDTQARCVRTRTSAPCQRRRVELRERESTPRKHCGSGCDTVSIFMLQSYYIYIYVLSCYYIIMLKSVITRIISRPPGANQQITRIFLRTNMMVVHAALRDFDAITVKDLNTCHRQKLMPYVHQG